MSHVEVEVDEDVVRRFPGLRVIAIKLENLSISLRDESLEELKKTVYSRIKSTYSLETLKDVPTFRAYRDFFWRIGIDPTKMRPSSEALVRRVLQGRDIPTINTLVDSYNLASMESHVTEAAYDTSALRGGLKLTFAKEGEEFLGIGMKEPIRLSGREIVVRDEELIVSVYPYRDSDYSKTTTHTKEAILMICGVPGIPLEKLREAERLSVTYISRTCMR